MFKFFIHLTILSFFLIFSSYAKNYERIIINGNERISSETILVFSEISEDQSLNENSINNILKKLYKSGYFKDVSVKIENNNLIINVLENLLGIKFLEVYFIDYFPIDMRLSWILFICFFSFLLTLLSSIYPARVASKIEPAEVLKYE